MINQTLTLRCRDVGDAVLYVWVQCLYNVIISRIVKKMKRANTVRPYSWSVRKTKKAGGDQFSACLRLCRSEKRLHRFTYLLCYIWIVHGVKVYAVYIIGDEIYYLRYRIGYARISHCYWVVLVFVHYL